MDPFEPLCDPAARRSTESDESQKLNNTSNQIRLFFVLSRRINHLTRVVFFEDTHFSLSRRFSPRRLMIVLRKNWSGQLIFLGPVSDPGVAPHTGRNVTRSRPEGVEPSGPALKHDLFARPTLQNLLGVFVFINTV